MFLIPTTRFGKTWLVFTHEDPRKAGFKGTVEDGVTLEYDIASPSSQPNGQHAPEVSVVGRAAQNSKHYRVFKNRAALDESTFAPVPGSPTTFLSWHDYVRLQLDPPDFEQLDEEDWFNYLDKVDDESRRLRTRSPWPETPASTNRDDVAAWIAKRHFLTDTSIQEVWYLPQGSPNDEIRLLEVSDRVLSDVAPVEAVDFGIDVLGARFRLSIADVTRTQLDSIKSQATRLPIGWSTEQNRVMRRRDR